MMDELFSPLCSATVKLHRELDIKGRPLPIFCEMRNTLSLKLNQG